MSAFKGKKVVITGTFSVKKSEIKKKLQDAGAKIMTSVSKNTDLIVYGDNPGSKYDKALDLDLDRWDESEMEEELKKKKKKKRGKKRKKPPTPSSDESESESESESELDIDAMRVVDLKKELRKRDLDTTGRKADLQKRLRAALDGTLEEKDDESESEEPPPKKKRRTTSSKSNTSTTTVKKVIKTTSSSSSNKKGNYKVDNMVPNSSSYSVVDDYDAMLNQTNIGQNNNKYYRIQLLTNGNGFWTWNRWGRVGENGQNAFKRVGSKDQGIKAFKKKFKDKTKNDWDNRANFQPYAKKYTLLEMDVSDDDDDDNTNIGFGSGNVNTDIKIDDSKSKLDKPLKSFLNLILDQDMFKEQMVKKNFDVKKMPLGKLSKKQIAKGFEVLVDLETELKKSRPSRNEINELSSEFYTLIPHSFGRRVPPPIDSMAMVHEKFEALEFLQDVENAQDVMDKTKTLDNKYKQMKCELKALDKKSELYNDLVKYFNDCKGSYGVQILDIFEVEQPSQTKRYKKFEKLDNKRLLWHGTNIAVVVAILKSGLRIMPHSGGRVGKGIYFASEVAKSLSYCSASPTNEFCVFLGEVALGKRKSINRDDSSLVRAPPGYDCIVAEGQHDWDINNMEPIDINGHDVYIPKGKIIHRPQYSNSNFDFSEYLVYHEEQNQIRFVYRLKWTNQWGGW